MVNNSAVALVIDYVVEVPNDDSILSISVGAVAKGNGDAVANIAIAAVIILVLLFNDTTVAVVNVAASAVANDALVAVIIVAQFQVVSVALAAVALCCYSYSSQ